MAKRKRVWFYRARAAFWLVFGVAAFPLGWAQSVALVWAASVYANIGTDLSASEAADDSAVLAELKSLKSGQDALAKRVEMLGESMARQVECGHEHAA